ncbi:MAG: heavy-metal-associated domain-containing protein, partial [Actinobacteria bacterium]|nr:heavy-metal-associated domain-containing protein [Actinomycetota bacterium]
MSTTIGPSDTHPERQIDLPIEGMTCTSCAARIERRLNKLEGVTATVNYATETARVSFPEGLDTAALVAEVEAAGYSARLPATAHDHDGAAALDQGPDPTRALRDRLTASAALT